MTDYQPVSGVTEEHRRAAFAALVSAQDSGLDVNASRELIANQHSLSLEEVRVIEREGLNQKWPPLG